jgi:hypothetical protein
MLNAARGALVEYSATVPPLALVFDFNPQTLSRTRSLTVEDLDTVAGFRGYSFTSPLDVLSAAQQATVTAESISLQILLDASDAIAERDEVARTLGIEPQLDTLRAMLEPKAQGPGGVKVLASLGAIAPQAFAQALAPSVLLFLWGAHVLPVLLTSVEVEEQQHLPTLSPSRAVVSLRMQVLEGQNPFYIAEQLRQSAGAAINTARTFATAAGGLT